MKRITTLFALLAVSAAQESPTQQPAPTVPARPSSTATWPGVANPGLILPMPRIRW